ncbi:MFS transporter [Streptomyces alfalfae]|uniref:MFS transporter n=1 Tax=Streptomyces alfalfae TaxID=1642299 RepID=A0ABM6H291_9ACTN|nr:MFS transporter [Streptomyces alfalfae]APY90254.1 MFS transporter [Streptomyces alfalfae]AYA20713.1 MFS transporter [Streptomyces fradiae]RXX34920.1 MFS transporter [Streptomyces alfalfae]RZM98025.1 MFS transporter [Streptomyces alfalfae]
MYLATTDAVAKASEQEQSGARRGRVAGPVLALGAVSLVTDISSEMVTAVLPLYFVLQLGLSPLQFGFLDGLYNGVTALVRLAGGYAADRGGRHKLVAGGGYALSALSRLGLLLAGGATAGIGAALAADRIGKGVRTAPRDALISLSSPPDVLGRAFGVHRAMDTTGALLGPLAAFALLWATADAYDAVFVVSFCFGLLGVLMLAAFVPGHLSQPAPRPPRPPGVATERHAPAAPRPRALGLLRVPAFRRVLLAAALLGAATIGDAFLYLLLQRRLDFAISWFPLLPLGAAAVYLLLAVPAGRLADRVGRRMPFLAGHIALLGGYVLLLAPTDGWPLLVGVLLLLGVFYAATDGVLMALVAPVVARERRASGMAVLQTGQALARLVAAAGFGAAWTLWGVETALTCAVVALTVAVAGAAALLPQSDTSSGGPP